MSKAVIVVNGTANVFEEDIPAFVQSVTACAAETDASRQQATDACLMACIMDSSLLVGVRRLGKRHDSAVQGL